MSVSSSSSKEKEKKNQRDSGALTPVGHRGAELGCSGQSSGGWGDAWWFRFAARGPLESPSISDRHRTVMGERLGSQMEGKSSDICPLSVVAGPMGWAWSRGQVTPFRQMQQ